jgi:hypothetical protein
MILCWNKNPICHTIILIIYLAVIGINFDKKFSSMVCYYFLFQSKNKKRYLKKIPLCFTEKTSAKSEIVYLKPIELVLYFVNFLIKQAQF